MFSSILLIGNHFVLLQKNNMDTIIDKQIIWAKRKGIALDEKLPYTKDLRDNLFQNLSKITENEFKKADGGELNIKDGKPAKMAALRSSSALCVNIMDYFRDKPNELLKLMVAMRLISSRNESKAELKFEYKDFKITANGKHISTPNIDVVITTTHAITNKEHTYIIESKFMEPYLSHTGNFFRRDYYLPENISDIWRGPLKNLYTMFGIANAQETLQTSDNRNVYGKYIKQNFKHLDAAQLTKHLMGTLQKENKSDVTLVYLWYDKLGEEGAEHRREIKTFKEMLNDTKINFKHCSYQEIVLNLHKLLDYNKHRDYLNYISERYL